MVMDGSVMKDVTKRRGKLLRHARFHQDGGAATRARRRPAQRLTVVVSQPNQPSDAASSPRVSS
jgi:hypothetical protein